MVAIVLAGARGEIVAGHDFDTVLTVGVDVADVREARERIDADGVAVVIGIAAPEQADLGTLIERHEAGGAVCSIAIEQTGDVGDRDVVVLGADDRVVGYQSSPGPAEALSDRVDAGLHVVGREAFDYLPDEPVSDWRRDAIPALLGHDVPVLAVELAP